MTTTINRSKKSGLVLSVLFSSFLLSGNAIAEGDAENGGKLFAASNCGECHGTEMYTNKDRKVKSLDALEAAVRLNDSKLNTNWFDEDVKDVTAYLNQQYYKF